MSRLRLGRSFWLARSAGTSVRWPELRGAVDVDVAIVGGGFTGAATALRFSDAGARVALVDEGPLARGSTAASTALLMQEPDEDFAHLVHRYGADRTRRIWELSRMATAESVRLLQRLRIACNLERRDSVYYALTADHERDLLREHGLRRSAGVGGEWLDSAAAGRALGFPAPAAIRTHGNAQGDPYRAALGLLNAAEARGARLFARTPATRIDTDSRRVTIRTPRGAIRADRVVIATGYATPSFRPLQARFRLLHTYVVVTRRLRAAERRALGLGHVMIWDSGRPYHYARWTVDDRLMLGGADRPRVPAARRTKAAREGTAAVRAFFVERYPLLEEIAIEYAWDGLFATTPDGLPYIGPHRRYPRHLFALGYGGNGMTFGFLAARFLLEMYRGQHTTDHGLFAFRR